MPVTNATVDAYIQAAKPFAQPVLDHLRAIVHKACANIEESIKWGFPNFMYQGKILCSMAAFKDHCAFHFWLASEMQFPKSLTATEGMGQLGKIKYLQDLPADDILISLIQQAMKLTQKGIVPKKNLKQTPIETPDYLAEALQKNKPAKAAFEKLPPSHRKEYITWIDEAKTESTREKRIATTMEWVLEGKSRNWKYEKK